MESEKVLKSNGARGIRWFLHEFIYPPFIMSILLFGAFMAGYYWYHGVDLGFVLLKIYSR